LKLNLIKVDSSIELISNPLTYNARKDRKKKKVLEKQFSEYFDEPKINLDCKSNF